MGNCNYCLSNIPHYDFELKNNAQFDYARYKSCISWDRYRQSQSKMQEAWESTHFESQGSCKLNRDFIGRNMDKFKGGVPNTHIRRVIVSMFNLNVKTNIFRDILKGRILPEAFARNDSSFYLTQLGFTSYQRLMYILGVMFPQESNSVLVGNIVQVFLWYFNEDLTYQAMVTLISMKDSYWVPSGKYHTGEERRIYEFLRAKLGIGQDDKILSIVKDMFSSMLNSYLSVQDYSVFFTNYLAIGINFLRTCIISILSKYYKELISLIEKTVEIETIQNIFRLRLDIDEVIEDTYKNLNISLTSIEQYVDSDRGSLLSKYPEIQKVVYECSQTQTDARIAYSIDNDGLDPKLLFSKLQNSFLLLIEILNSNGDQLTIGLLSFQNYIFLFSGPEVITKYQKLLIKEDSSKGITFSSRASEFLVLDCSLNQGNLYVHKESEMLSFSEFLILKLEAHSFHQ